MCKMCEICLRTVKNFSGKHKYMDGFPMGAKWLKSKQVLSVFIRNKGKEISSHGNITFHYITSKDNPADILIRGSDMHSLSCNQ